MQLWIHPRSTHSRTSTPPPTPTPRPAPPPPPPADPWAAALDAARELTLAACRSTRRFPPGCGAEVGADLRRTATAVALELEEAGVSPTRLMPALRALWRTGDLIDKAERLGLMDLEAAVELLALGSRVEIPLVTCIAEAGRG